MRILMILDHPFPPDIRVENEIESLGLAGHEVHIACLTGKNKTTHEIASGCIIHRKNISRLRYKTSVGILKFPCYFNFWRRFINDIASEYSFDAVHIHDLPLALIGVELKKRLKIKFVLDLHENWPVLLQLSQHTNSFLGKILSS